MHLNVFTIVLNGMPTLPHVFTSLCRTVLGYPWRWTIVHGIAEPVADTDWCAPMETVEDDGTRAMMEDLRDNPRVTIIRQPRWPGKTAMCNAALATFTEAGILMQMDADEIWTPEQLRNVIRLFDNAGANGAQFLARNFVGPNRVVFAPGQWGNRAFEWRRAWRFEPGMKFVSHEPPKLDRPTTYFSPAWTAAAGLVFDHYSYATEAQVAFKEKYYQRPGLVEQWKALNAETGACSLRKHFPWIKEEEDALSFPVP